MRVVSLEACAPTVRFDATEDFWTCHRVRCAGVWTTERFAREVGRHFSIWYPIRCQAVTHIRWPFCQRCGFPDPNRQYRHQDDR